MPGDLLHFSLGGQTLVLVEGTLADREVDFALDIESPTEDFLFRGAEAGDDVTARTTTAQGLATFGSSSFYCHLNHGHLFFQEAPCASVKCDVRGHTKGANVKIRELSVDRGEDHVTMGLILRSKR